MMPVGLKAMRWNQTRMLKKADRLDHSRQSNCRLKPLNSSIKQVTSMFHSDWKYGFNTGLSDLNPSDRSTMPEIYV